MSEAHAQPAHASQPQPARGATPEQTAPSAGPPWSLLAMQRTIGNQAVQRQLRAGALPPRLIVGQQSLLGNQWL